MSTISICGFSTEQIFNSQRHECEFEEYTEDFYISKQVFHHREEGLNFDYRYCIELIDPSYTEIGSTLVEISMVPTFKSLGKSKKNDILEYSCCDDPNEYDIHSYGLAVALDSFTFKDKELDETPESVNKLLIDVSNLILTVDSMRGFILDRPINRIGSTGWDMVYSWGCDKSFLDPILDRIKGE